jgi:hypothetical protein
MSDEIPPPPPEILANMAKNAEDVLQMLERHRVPQTSRIIIETIFGKGRPMDYRPLRNITTLFKAAERLMDDDLIFHALVENVADKFGRYRLQVPNHRVYPRYDIVPYQCAIASDLQARGTLTQTECVKLRSLIWGGDDSFLNSLEDLMLLGDVLLDSSVLQRALSHVIVKRVKDLNR